MTLLFLSRAGMPHERLWAAWLGSVRGLLPLSHVRVRADVMFIGSVDGEVDNARRRSVVSRRHCDHGRQHG